jgi:GDPmannose 4,6-dehydratase
LIKVLPEEETASYYLRSPYGAPRLTLTESRSSERHPAEPRGETLMRKIMRTVARIETVSEDALYLGNPEAKRDRGPQMVFLRRR